MCKKTLRVLLTAIVLLSVQAGGAGADTLHGTAPSPTDYQVEYAVYTQAGEKSMFTKIMQNLFTTTLHMATKIGDVDKIRSLLAKGHDVNGPDKNGATPLFWAAFTEDLEVARILVEHGADINYRNPMGSTPLYNALHKRNKDLALWLLEQGADPLATDANGITILHIASMHGMEDVVAILLARGADINAISVKGHSPLSLYLYVQLQMPPVFLSAQFIFQLLEAGAQYDPLPQMEKSLADICFEFEIVNPYLLKQELVACIQRTSNEDLRAYARGLLDRLEELEFISEHGENAVRKMHSAVLGTIVRGKYDTWKADPIAIPLYNNEKHAVLCYFDPENDPNFLAEADKALAAFLQHDDAFRLSLSERASEHAKPILNNWIDIDYKAENSSDWLGLRDPKLDGVWLTAFVAGEKKAEDVWRMVGNIWEVYVARNTADGLIYVVVLWNCLWDEEHGFQLVFREGANLTRMSDGDGELAD